MDSSPPGCGKTDVALTLYFVAANHKPKALPVTFGKISCGHILRSASLQGDSYGIAVCETCAIRAHFIPVPK